MSDLVAWLSERLDEDEAAALECVDKSWTAGEVSPRNVYGAHERVAEGADYRYAEHIARHDPARVLAEVAAKRAIVAEVESWEHHADPDAWVWCPLAPQTRRRWPEEEHADECRCGRDARARTILAPLAAVYADCEGYDERWRP